MLLYDYSYAQSGAGDDNYCPPRALPFRQCRVPLCFSMTMPVPIRNPQLMIVRVDSIGQNCGQRRRLVGLAR